MKILLNTFKIFFGFWAALALLALVVVAVCASWWQTLIVAAFASSFWIARDWERLDEDMEAARKFIASETTTLFAAPDLLALADRIENSPYPDGQDCAEMLRAFVRGYA